MALQPRREDDTSGRVEATCRSTDNANPNHQSVIVQQLGCVVVAGQKLAHSLPSVQLAITKIEDEQENMEKMAKLEKEINPEIVIEINKLKREFRSCINDAKFFLRACSDLAEYGVDEKIHTVICQELYQRKLHELTAFVGVFLTYLEKCRSRLIEFKDSHDKARESAQSSMDKYTRKGSTSQEHVQMAKKKQTDAQLKGNASRGMQYVSGTIACAGLFMGSFGACSPRTTATAVVVGGLALTASWLYQHIPAADGLEEKQKLSRNLKDQSIFTDAKNCIKDLQTSMDGVVEIIDEMWRHAKQASDEIDGKHRAGLKKYTGPPQNLPSNEAHYRDIEHKLKSLRTSMFSILEQLGPDGANISTRPDEVVNNTSPEQASAAETLETTPNYAESLHLPTTSSIGSTTNVTPVESTTTHDHPHVQIRIPQPIQEQAPGTSTYPSAHDCRIPSPLYSSEIKEMSDKQEESEDDNVEPKLDNDQYHKKFD